MDGPREYPTKWSKRERQISWYHGITYLWNLKPWCKWTYLQNGNGLTDRENKFMATKDGRVGKDELGVSG